MRLRCRTAQPVVPVQLKGWQLVFRGVADIIHTGDDTYVNGALYTFTKSDELALDRYEGFNKADQTNGLYRKVYLRMLLNGQKCRIMFYVMNRDRISPPSAGYYHTIEQGYRDWHLNVDTLIAARSSSIKDSYYASR